MGAEGMSEVSEAEATRRYHQYELGRVTPDDLGVIKVKFFGGQDSKHLNITPEQFAAIKNILVPEDPSPVNYDPCITGTIDIEGRKSEFMLLLDRADVGYSQWGADNTVLWPRTDLLEGMSASAKEWWADQQDGLTGFTVSGYWGDDDTRIVTSVIEGEHEVSGGDDVSEGGPFAVYVRAEDAAAAESKVQGTTEEDDLDE
jgi:hypothetical protein